jgi:hypothetical protein
MKKITLLLTLLIFTTSFSNIIVRDITDFTFTSNATLDFDFNNDGTSEFTFEEMGGTIGCMFDYTKVNFYGTGTLNSGHGWDVIRSLTINTLIGASSTFDAQGDAYINPSWAYSNEMFPNGDSYVGTTFKIGASRYYGWILINSTSGVIKVKSYAYNDVANQSINAGQGNLGTNEVALDSKFVIYPNPVKNTFSIIGNEAINAIEIYDSVGKLVFSRQNPNNEINIDFLSKGFYISLLKSENNTSVVKLIKE